MYIRMERERLERAGILGWMRERRLERCVY